MSDFLGWWSDPLAYRFMARGMVLALLLGVAGGVVGCLLLLRRMVLMADSFSHALLPGVGAAYLCWGAGGGGLLAGALAAGLVTGTMSALLGRLTRLTEEAAFGCLFVLCFAGGVMLMSRAAAPGDLLHLLFGNILGLTHDDVVLVWLTTAVTLVALALFYRLLAVDLFDPVHHRATGGPSLAVHLGLLTVVVLNLVAALQAVGMVLALGLFILPAATALLWCDRFGSLLLLAAALGGILAPVGLLVSFHLDLPSGACMVGSLGVAFLTSLVLSPRHGLRAARRRAAG